MKANKLWDLTFIAATLLSSALASAESGVTDALKSALPKGWECLQGPNELDRPGRTFYIDKSGVRYELADLHEKIQPETGAVSSVAAQSSGYVSAGLFAKLLRLGNVLSLSGSKTYATSVVLLQRQEVRTEEANARAALRSLDPSLIDSANTYYIIRNTQLARQMRLTVDRSIAGEFGGAIPFGKLVQVSGAAKTPNPASKSGTVGGTDASAAGSAPIVSAEDSHTYTIDQTFDKPMTVCFLAQKFTLKSVAGGVGGTVKDARLVAEYWNPSAKK